MGALSTDNINIKSRQGASVIRSATASTALYGGSVVQSNTSGTLVPVSNASGKFEGFSQVGTGVSATAAERKMAMSRKGMILCTITSVDASYLGKPVWAPTDNPGDLTLTYTAGAKLVGWVDDLEYDNLGAVANKAWVYFDAPLLGNAYEHQEKTSPALIGIVGTVREAFYRVPVGKNAQLYLVNWTQQVKPNFATSATLNLTTISGATRTNLITGVDLNNTGSLDTPAAATISSTVQVLAAGDILEAELVCVSTLSAAGKVNVHCNLWEYAKI